jgi:tetratricopeptide (TPR) repeat protein
VASTPREAPRWLPALVFFLTLVCFLPAMSGTFLNWDDNVNFQDNPSFRGGSAWERARTALTSTLFGHYIPLTRLSWSLNHALGGMKPWGYHLANLLLHAGNAALAYLVARRLLEAGAGRRGLEGQRPYDLSIGAVVAALFWGLHPLRVEPVAWITGRADVLCGTFVLLATWLYLKAVEGEGTAARPGPLVASAVALAAAILSKGVAVTLPAVLLVLDVYPLRRLARGGLGRLLREKVALISVSVAGAIVIAIALKQGAQLTRPDSYGAIARVAVAAYSFCIYPLRSLWPMSLSPLYEMPSQMSLSEPRFGLALVASALVTALLILARRRWPAGLATWVCCAIMLAPTSVALRLGADLAPDRYSYLPALPISMLLGGAVVWIARTVRSSVGGRRALAVGAGLVIGLGMAGFAAITWVQVQIWHDDLRLWQRAVDVDPESPTAASNLGSALRARGRLAEAAQSSERGLRLKPDFPEAHLNLALIRAAQGRSADAEQLFRRTLELRPRSAPAHLGLAATLEGQGRLDEALQEFRAAIEIEPRSAGAHNGLGVALARSGRIREARPEFAEAVRLDPGSAEAQNNLGLALVQTGQAAEAVAHFQAAVAAAPEFGEARQNLERTLRLLGR